jgi:hypothetical protein
MLEAMITFKVSDVAVDRSPLPAISAAAWLARLGWTAPEAWKLGAEAVVDGEAIHPLALAASIAFAEHRPLLITPDAIWLTLAHGLAQHVELHAEELRPRLVRHQGRLELEVRRDDFVPGASDNDWPVAVAALAARVREHLGGRASLFVSDFSTSSALDRTASQVALLGAMRNYFDYSVSSLCGIPEITLTGTPEDWAAIRARVRVFGELDAARWAERLDPILARLEETARGTIDREHWRRFYKKEHMSGGERFAGWLGELFPYLGTTPTPNRFETDDDDPFGGIKPSELPSGRTRAPFTWKVPGAELPRELVAGLFGVTQDASSGALGVISGWCVAAPRPASGFRRRPGAVTLLMAEDCASLTSLDGLQHEATAEPTRLWLHPCGKLASLRGVEHLSGLESLSIHSATVLRDYSLLAGLPSLGTLELNACDGLEDLSFLAGLRGLRSLAIIGCRRIPRHQLHHVARLEELTELMITHCSQLGLAPDVSRHVTGRAAVATVQAALQSG